jgi:hypothetical protein
MRILKRTGRTPLYDEHLTYFTIVEAWEFRRLVASAFAKVGHDVTIYKDRVEDRSGTAFGLWNIAALCRGVDRHEWADLVDRHVESVTTPSRALSDLSPAEVESGLYLRLVEARSVPEPDRLGYARQVAPGLLEVLAVDLPDSVVTLSSDDLGGLGSLADLLERGRANLRALLAGDVALGAVAGARRSFTAVNDRSFFTASLALVLPEAVGRISGEVDRGRGILVAVPDRHQLLYRVIDAPSAASALRDMFDTARWAFYEGSGPLSPNVYWVRDRRWAQVTSVDGGKPRVWLRGEFAGAIKRSA